MKDNEKEGQGKTDSLSSLYRNRMRSLLGNGVQSYLDSLNDAPTKGIVVNTQKVEASELKNFVSENCTKLGFAENCYSIGDIKNVGKRPYHHAGAIYMQEPSAMLPVNAVDIDPSSFVLDLCAAPGGKSIQMALKLTEGCLVSNEIDHKRAGILSQNIERMGLKNVIITSQSPSSLEHHFSNMFDIVIVDAPCSGEGMFRKEPTAIQDWGEENVAGCAVRQRNILKSADAMLKSGGLLIYSTCTFSVSENEENVNWFMKEYQYSLVKPRDEVIAITKEGVDEPLMRRVYPHTGHGEGQFFAVLKKNTGSFSYHELNVNTLDKKYANIYYDFCDRYLKERIPCVNIGENLYFQPFNIPKDIKPFRNGVKLGKIEKSRFVPDHNLYTAFGHSFIQTVPLNEIDVLSYIHGEELLDFPQVSNGYVCLTYNGLTLGGGKAVDGRIKNHYPKGLRNFS